MVKPGVRRIIYNEPQIIRWSVGEVAVYVTDGTNQEHSPLSNHEIHAKKVALDGSLQWFKKGVTDDNGILKFDLEGLSNGVRYRLFARSKSSGKWQESDLISQNGLYGFTVGHLPIPTKAVDEINGQTLANYW